MPPANDQNWCPFRPTTDNLKTIAQDVAEIPTIQQTTNTRDPHLCFPDRVAHQYQVAGGRVLFQVENNLPACLQGIGLFQPGAEYTGIGRISTGLGVPHLETNPDFLGIMTAFLTPGGQRVDFLGINDPTSPADNHRDFMSVLHATGESAGVEVPFVGQLGGRDLINLAAQQTVFGQALAQRMGAVKAVQTLAHLTRQTLRTCRSSTAYQTYWTGIVETGDTGGKFTFVPVVDENHLPGLEPGERYLSEEWKRRQLAGDIVFQLYLIPFLDEARTPTRALTDRWDEESKQRVGRIVFPQTEPNSDEAGLWSSLAAEMGANPANWIANRENSVREPATEFGNARKLAYQKSQEGRRALAPETYQSTFQTGRISPELARELSRRRSEKTAAGHVDHAPSA